MMGLGLLKCFTMRGRVGQEVELDKETKIMIAIKESAHSM